MKTTDIPSTTAMPPPDAGTESRLALGTRLADFEITGILGEGGFGIVYLAFDHSLQRTVAIKEYMPGALAGRGADQSVVVRSERHRDTFDVGLKSFINEARFLAQFDHPSLVKVYRYWEQNRTAYTAMRYYDGRTIKDIVASNPELVTEEWCKFIFKQILEALETLYKMKILHRDVSPDNIIVQPNGDAVLLDFGSARQIIGDMTQGLTVILKPGYAPIEQYASDASMEQGPWTDIYALSAVMYFAIVKEAPTTSIARMIKDPLPPLQSRGLVKFSERFLTAIDKGLAVQAQDRPQTIDEFRKLLGINAFGSGRRPSGSSRKAKERAAQAAQAAALKRKKAEAGAGSLFDTLLVDLDRRWIVGGGAVALVLALVGLGLYASAPGDVMMVAQSNRPATSADPQANSQADPQTAAEEAAWLRIKDDPRARAEQIAAFIHQFPAGRYAEAAAVRLSGMPAAAAQPVAEPAAADPAPAAPVAAVPNTAEAAAADHAKADPGVNAAEASAEAVDPAAPMGIKLVVNPWGTVYVDGQEKGVSPPLKKLMLSPGKHKIRIFNPSFPEYLAEIEVVKNKSSPIRHDFSAPGK